MSSIEAPRRSRRADGGAWRGARRSGAALLDALTALAILAGIAAVAAPVYRSLDARLLEQDAQALAAQLREARALSIAHGVATTVSVDARSKTVETRLGVDREQAPKGQALKLERATTLSGRAARLRSAAPAFASGDGSSHRTTALLEMRFFPDGSATGGEVVLTSASAARRLRLDWATGAVDIAPELVAPVAARPAEPTSRGRE